MFVWYPTGVLKQQHAAESKIHTSASKLTYEGTLSIHHQFVNIFEGTQKGSEKN